MSTVKVANQSVFTSGAVEVASPNVTYSETTIQSKYTYDTTVVDVNASTGKATVVPVQEHLVFTTERKVPKTGVLIVGLGGNNGTTFTGGILANKHNITWMTTKGQQSPDYIGSVTQATTVKIGSDAQGKDVYVPFSSLLPMVHPNDLVIHGWDISGMHLGDAMKRAEVFDYNLQLQLYPLMKDITPLPSIYYPSFIAANQNDRADNLIPGTDKQVHLDTIRQQIKDFKLKNHLDKVIVLWSANTERFVTVTPELHGNATNLLAAIARSEEEISPSIVFAVASILEGCSFINGSPQNTLVPGVVDLAVQHGVYVGGSDFKSGQTKLKSVLVDFLVGAGIKPVSIVSYNHLGNNDGKNLSAPQQFRSKEISKSDVVLDMVESNPLLYPDLNGHENGPDHLVVIKYVPYVGDSKRALDEYTSKIFMNGENTIVIHNTCEDSLLATPLMIDLVILTEICERIRVQRVDATGSSSSGASPTGENSMKFHAVLSILSYLLKAPLVPDNAPVINALFRQKEAIVNIFKACVGLPADNHMLLEHRFEDAYRHTKGGFFTAATKINGHSL